MLKSIKMVIFDDVVWLIVSLLFFFSSIQFVYFDCILQFVKGPNLHGLGILMHLKIVQATNTWSSLNANLQFNSIIYNFWYICTYNFQWRKQSEQKKLLKSSCNVGSVEITNDNNINNRIFQLSFAFCRTQKLYVININIKK